MNTEALKKFHQAEDNLTTLSSRLFYLSGVFFDMGNEKMSERLDGWAALALGTRNLVRDATQEAVKGAYDTAWANSGTILQTAWVVAEMKDE